MQNLNWTMISVILGALAQLGVGIYFSGKNTERLDGLRRENDQIRNGCDSKMRLVNIRLDEHTDKLSEHSVQIAEGRSWREGFSAGRASAPGSHAPRV